MQETVLIDERALVLSILLMTQRQTGKDFRSYRMTTVRRRLERRRWKTGALSLAAYAGYMRQTPEECFLLAGDLEIGVSAFFRDQAIFTEAMTLVADALTTSAPVKERGFLSLWSCGCAGGEEPYSLAIFFLDELKRRGLSLELELQGSDISTSSLERARQGLYPEEALSSIPPAWRETYFEGEQKNRLTFEVMQHLVFRHRNILERMPTRRFDLAVFRNVMIYFEAAAKKKAVLHLAEAIRPGGFLWLGTADILPQNAEPFFEPHGPRLLRLYRRIGSISPFPDLPLVLPIAPVSQKSETLSSKRGQSLPDVFFRKDNHK